MTLIFWVISYGSAERPDTASGWKEDFALERGPVLTVSAIFENSGLD